MCRRCIWDILNLGVLYLTECSPADRRCSAIYRRWFLATIHRDNFLMHALNFLSMHDDYSRTTPIIRRTTGAWSGDGGDAQICADKTQKYYSRSQPDHDK